MLERWTSLREYRFQLPAFDAAFTEFQSAVGVDAQKTACAKIEQISVDDTPVAIPYFYNILFAHAKNVTGIVATGLGHFYCGKAGFTA